jgi:uncharacterized membrane protein YphA (DoxX/SURF4 family)
MKSFLADLLRLALGLVFASAGGIKIFEFNAFLNDISRFDMVPASLLKPAGVAIIGAEIILGSSLIIKFRVWLTALLLAGMTSAFTVAMFALAERDRTANCGCFGPLLPEKVGTAVILRDLLLIAACLWLAAADFLANERGQSVHR